MENQEFCAAPIIPGIPIGMPVPEVTQEDVETYLWMHHPMGRQLLDLEITPDKEVPHGEFLFRLQGKPCFRKGELVAITGKAKSGKTFFCSALMAAAGGGYSLGIRRISATPLRVLWIDTEQSEDSTQEILCQRIMKMLGGEAENKPRAINLRSVSWEDRMDLIESAIELAKPDLVLLDGIRDTIADINDGPGSQCVIDRCLRLASRSEACIVCVLHQNKAAEDKTLRGALGTELMNKCFETYECKKSEDRVLSVEQVLTRKYDIRERLYFTIADDGLPQLLTPGRNANTNENENQNENRMTNDNFDNTSPHNTFGDSCRGLSFGTRTSSNELDTTEKTEINGNNGNNANNANNGGALWQRIYERFAAIIPTDGVMQSSQLADTYRERYGIYSERYYYNTILAEAVNCGVLLREQTDRGIQYRLGQAPPAEVARPAATPQQEDGPP